MNETPARLNNLDDYVASLRTCATEAEKQLAFLAEYTNPDDDWTSSGEYSVWEIAAVSRATPRFVQNRIVLAHTLAARLPQTRAALRDGVIDEYKARRVAIATDVLCDDAMVSQVEDRVIPRAGECDATTLNSRLRYAIARVDPAGADARAEAKRAGREVRHDTEDDGAGILTIHGDVERTQLAYDRISLIARDLKTAGDDRTLDQIRADVALDCIAGKGFEHAKVQVWLTIPATTALGVDAKPGHLAGYGWLPAQRALELAAQQDATWQRVLTDPATGQVLDVGRHTYRPPAALRDHLRATHPTCSGPGCRRPAHRCDLDHVVPFPAGPTTSGNVRPLCRGHHNEKTHGGWRADVSADGTQLTWVTKHGYRFPYEPEPIADPESA